MRIYARIQDGVVAELLATEHDIGTMFHAALHWVDATETPGVAPGWRHDGEHLSAPPANEEQQAQG